MLIGGRVIWNSGLGETIWVRRFASSRKRTYLGALKIPEVPRSSTNKRGGVSTPNLMISTVEFSAVQAPVLIAASLFRTPWTDFGLFIIVTGQKPTSKSLEGAERE